MLATGATHPTPSRADSKRFETSLPYVAGLDGLRAIAVVAVLLYHARDIAGLPAVLRPASGFLGVEVFFVLSGYLITALLLAEHARGDGLGLLAFWRRRARRLLPGLYLLLVGVVIATAVLAESTEAIRRELAAALLYVSNWLLITDGVSYFESTGRPSLLRHLWSLAVEEQFYLLWPAVVLIGMRWFGRWPLFVLTVAAAAGSTALAWMLFDQLERYGDVTEIYYRTDARAAGLLIGAAAAFVWRPWLRAPSSIVRGRAFRWTLDAAGVAALAVVIWAQYAFTDQLVDWDAQRRLYQGGFLITSIPTIVLIGVVVNPGSRLGAALGGRLLRWVGTRSYALYLWHWPVYQLTRPRVDVTLDGWSSLVVRLAVTVLLAELSYRLVERPVRERRFVAALTGGWWWPSRGSAMRRVGNVAAVLAVAAMTVTLAAADRGESAMDRGASATTVAAPEAGLSPERTASRHLDVDDLVAGRPSVVGDSPVGFSSEPAASPGGDPAEEPPLSPASRVAAGAEPVVEPSITASPTAVVEPPPATRVRSSRSAAMTVVGDSVVLGASNELAKIGAGVSVYGEVGRQWFQIAEELRALAEDGVLADIVVIQLGNNGTLTPEIFDEVMALLADAELVLFVNVRVPRSWEADVNAEIASGVARHAPRARLADWHALSDDHPEFFLSDGVHLRHPGSEALRRLIESEVAR